MRYELYNSTNRVKQVPGYRYKGTVTLQPRTAVDVEDYMISFYRPWSKLGVYVRSKRDDAVLADDVSAANDSGTGEATTEPEAPAAEATTGEPAEAPTQPVEETIQDATDYSDSVIPSKVYTEAELGDYNIKELKEIAESLGAEFDPETKKRAPLIEAILAKQAQ